jgi:hypothetical protein
MAFDAGSIVGKINLETGEFTGAINGAIGKTQNLTKSMFTAQAAFALVQKAVQAVTGFVKDSIGAWNAQEQAIAITRATLKSTGNAIGMTVKELVYLSGEVQKNTTFADENVLAAQNMLLTYTKIGKDIFPRTTMAIADMSARIGDLNGNARLVGRALEDPIRGLTMLQRMGVTFSASQKDQIENFVKTNQLGKAQAIILTELEKKFGGSAAAIRNTFGGAVTALNNTWGDFQENIGQYAAAVGRPLVENLNQIVGAINKWLTSTEGMETISDILSNVAAAFETIKMVAQPIVDAIGPALEGIINQIKDTFTQLVGKGNEGTVVFTALAVVGKSLAIVFTIIGKVIELTIRTIGNLIDAIKLSAQLVGALVDSLAHLGDPAYAKKLVEAGKKAGDAWVKFVADQVNGTIDIVNTGVNGIVNIIKTADSEGKKLEASFKRTQETRKKEIKDYLNGTTEESARAMTKLLANGEETGRKLTDIEKEWSEARKTIGESELQTKIRQLNEQADKYREVAKDKAEVDKWLAEQTKKANDSAAKSVGDAWKETWEKAQSEFSAYSSFFTGIQNQIIDIWNQALSNEQTALDNDYEARKANIEANVTDEEERTRQLAALEEEYAAATAEIEKKKWIAQQAAAVTGAIMAGAQAVMQGFALLGPIGGAIAATAIGVLTAIQVGLIVGQPMPSFASGGIAGPGPALVGENGPEVVQFERSARVYSNEESRAMFGGSGPQMNNYFGDVHNDTDTDRASAIIAAQYRAMLRGAA